LTVFETSLDPASVRLLKKLDVTVTEDDKKHSEDSDHNESVTDHQPRGKDALVAMRAATDFTTDSIPAVWTILFFFSVHRTALRLIADGSEREHQAKFDLSRID